MLETFENSAGDCDCATLRAKVEELVHGELCAEESQSLRAHLACCDDCACEEDALNTLTDAVKRACQEQAPQTLREVILQQLGNMHPAQSRGCQCANAGGECCCSKQ